MATQKKANQFEGLGIIDIIFLVLPVTLVGAGAIGAAFMVIGVSLNLKLVKSKKTKFVKYSLCVLVTAACWIAAIILAGIILSFIPS